MDRWVSLSEAITRTGLQKSWINHTHIYRHVFPVPDCLESSLPLSTLEQNIDIAATHIPYIILNKHIFECLWFLVRFTKRINMILFFPGLPKVSCFPIGINILEVKSSALNFEHWPTFIFTSPWIYKPRMNTETQTQGSIREDTLDIAGISTSKWPLLLFWPIWIVNWKGHYN